MLFSKFVKLVTPALNYRPTHDRLPPTIRQLAGVLHPVQPFLVQVHAKFKKIQATRLDIT